MIGLAIELWSFFHISWHSIISIWQSYHTGHHIQERQEWTTSFAYDLQMTEQEYNSKAGARS
jgi:hypothetical protein